MTKPQTTSRQDSLTGVWNGLYTYPASLEPGAFTATLLQFGSTLSGTVHEPDLFGDTDAGLLYAEISGSKKDTAVEFAKTYDGTGGWEHTVFYAGVLSDDGLEIEGTWTIPEVWQGRFLMIRSGPEVTAERRTAFHDAEAGL